MQTTTYIKGFFRATPEAEAKLAELAIANPAHYAARLDGLWGSVTVPDGVFKHKPGSPALPGWLDLA
jgi:hypothetical protein